jgi:two-component system, LytTR family, sensor kinase
VKTARLISQIVLLLAALLALIPVSQAAMDWWEVTQYRDVIGLSIKPGARGSDWVVWEDDDGVITAEHVFPNGPGFIGGIREGDRFYMLDYQQFFDSEDLKNAISGIKPGATRSFLVVRDDQILDLPVTIERHPTFLYPRSSGVWQFAMWGFTIGAFFHLLALFIAGPLALHSRRARFEVLVIAVSSLWIFGNLARLIAIQLFGPPIIGSAYDGLFQVLTFIGLVGWLGFPVMLVRKLADDANLLSGPLGKLLPLSYLPTFVLSCAVLWAALLGHIGPFTLEDFLLPILFYASVFIGSAAAISFGLSFLDTSKSGRSTIQWGRLESAVIFSFSLLAGLIILEFVPLMAEVNDQTASWFIVAAQLLAVVPVTLYSVGTLRYGKVNEVLSGAFVYVLIIGLIFFTFVGGLSLMDFVLAATGNSRIVLEGIYVVILLVLFERVARKLRLFASSFFASERFKARQDLSRFNEKLPDIMGESALSEQAIEVVGRVFGAQSAIIFVKSPADESWIVKRYQPEVPYFTEQIFEGIWQYFEHAPTIWARNSELNEHPLPVEGRKILLEHQAALAIPIKGESAAIGLMILGLKEHKRAVYNLEDLGLLRSLAGNLALAINRLMLVEREKKLATESTQAHLVALRAQINPHFLFNALNTLLALIEEKPHEAEAVVEHLSAIFRHTLQTGSRAFVKMDEEVSLVEHYLAIEKARFGEKLQVECIISDDVRSIPVPPFVIQTVVENSIKHGLEKRRAVGLLTVSISLLSNGNAEVTVTDSGVGIPELFGQKMADFAKQSFFGIGLSNVHDRLRQLYDDDNLMLMESDPETGTRVTLYIPPSRNRSFDTDSGA